MVEHVLVVREHADYLELLCGKDEAPLIGVSLLIILPQWGALMRGRY
jgi:hypothetical protein